MMWTSTRSGVTPLPTNHSLTALTYTPSRPGAGRVPVQHVPGR